MTQFNITLPVKYNTIIPISTDNSGKINYDDISSILSQIVKNIGGYVVSIDDYSSVINLKNKEDIVEILRDLSYYFWPQVTEIP